MELLYKYLNGNVVVSIYDNGTKIQEWPDEEEPSPIFPNSFDLKITDYCDLNCAFCHEMSTTSGIHGDLHKMLDIVKILPPGTELAIGGGNPLDHPDLVAFLSACKSLGLICNLTVNHKHILSNLALLNKLLDNTLIYGLGISIDGNSNLKIMELLDKRDNIVYHVISGVDSINILEKIKESKVSKVLVLGYKEVGRGIKFFDKKVEENKKEWHQKLYKYIGKIHLSFDNLAIKQLNVKRFFNDSRWKELYCGGDGVFTFYIDLPKEQYAMSSTSNVRYELESNIAEMFKNIRNSL